MIIDFKQCDNYPSVIRDLTDTFKLCIKYQGIQIKESYGQTHIIVTAVTWIIGLPEVVEPGKMEMTLDCALELGVIPRSAIRED